MKESIEGANLIERGMLFHSLATAKVMRSTQCVRDCTILDEAQLVKIRYILIFILSLFVFYFS